MTRPNVLLVVMDTTRADHLSCYGYSRRTTPNLDSVAESGTRFENAIAPAPWTLPSHTSLITGLIPSEHGVRHGEHSLRDDVTTLPEALSAAGYRTGIFSNNPWISPTYDFDRGIDEFQELFREQVHQYKSGIGRQITRLRKALFLSDSGADLTNDRVISWISDGDQEPFFALLNYMEPHQVYAPRRPYHRKFDSDGLFEPYREVITNRNLHRNRGRVFAGQRRLDNDEIASRTDLYDREIAYLDHKIGELVESLERLGVFDDTLLVVVGDHGQAFCEHSPFGHQLVNHHFSLYDSLVRVPMIARLPGVFDGGTVTELVQLTDVLPTVSELISEPAVDTSGRVSAEPLTDPNPDRVARSEYVTPPSVLGPLREQAPDFDWSTYDVDLKMARSPTEKLIRYEHLGREELYDLTEDPGEQRDLRDERDPPAELTACLDDWPEHDDGESGAAAHDDDVRSHLSDLGYL